MSAPQPAGDVLVILQEQGAARRSLGEALTKTAEAALEGGAG